MNMRLFLNLLSPFCSTILNMFPYDDVQSAVTWLCFSPNSDQIITASKDGSIRIWNIHGMNSYINSFVKYLS